jgi:hypothetical protein
MLIAEILMLMRVHVDYALQNQRRNKLLLEYLPFFLKEGNTTIRLIVIRENQSRLIC